MAQHMNSVGRNLPDRGTVRRRIKQMYEQFNQGNWEKCFSFLDPTLIQQSTLALPIYAEKMQAFKDVYGIIHPWHIRINLHLDTTSAKQDKRPFAYAYIIWQDEMHGFHMFRERWLKHQDR